MCIYVEKEVTGKMKQLCRKIVHVKIRWSVLEKVRIFRQFFKFLWKRIFVCSIGKPAGYRRFSRRSDSDSSDSPSPPSTAAIDSGYGQKEEPTTTCSSGYESDSDLVTLKISILGDCQIGKTSFVVCLILYK